MADKNKGGELDDMKKELEWDEHKVDLSELIKRYQVSRLFCQSLIAIGYILMGSSLSVW